MVKFLFDYDSTIANTGDHRLTWVNEKFGSTYTPEEITSWLSEGYFHPVHEKWMWGPDCFMSVHFQAEVPPVEGAIEGIQSLLAMGHEGMVVSDRPPELFEVTRDWLDRNGLDVVRLLFTKHKHSMNTEGTYLTKLQAAYLYKLKFVVEDAPHHSFNLAQKDYIDRVYLLDMPYNQDIEHPKIVRVNSWEEIVTFLTPYSHELSTCRK